MQLQQRDKKRRVLPLSDLFHDTPNEGGDGNDTEYWKTRGAALAEEGKFGEALDAFLQADMGDAAVHEMRAQCLLQLDRNFLALHAAEQAVELKPSWLPAHLTLARCLREIGEIELSVESFRSASELDPSDEQAKEGLLEMRGLLQRLEEVRIHKQRELEQIESPQEQEAVRCMLNLQSRTPPHPPVTWDSGGTGGN